MEREIWCALVPLVRRIASEPVNKRFSFDWSEIVLVLLWSVIWMRPVSWATDPANWPDDLRPKRLPTPSTLSRRLRQPMALQIFIRAIRHVQRGLRRELYAAVDGKPLTVSRHSQDPDARFGRGAGGLSKGYKLHLIYSGNSRIEGFEVWPLNVDERVVARELIKQVQLHGYLLADSMYDDNKLHANCAARGVQLVAPRSKAGSGLGHRRHHPARLRSIEMLENPENTFGSELYASRLGIERMFGHWSSASYGLFTLPPWVRRLHRVKLWVAASLFVFAAVQRRRRMTA